MKLVDDFLKSVGDSGFPAVVDSSLLDTWNLYQDVGITPENRWDRVLSCLGFFHLLHQAGMSRKINGKSDPKALYQAFRLEEFSEEARTIVDQLMRYRLFDAFRPIKTRFNMSKTVRLDNRILRVDICLTPRRNEQTDSALSKLEGLLYRGDLPIQLQEKWRKLSPTSTRKPSSSLPNHMRVINSDTLLGFLPLLTDKNSAIYIRRVADGMIVLRVVLTVSAKPVPWLAPRKHDELLKSWFAKAFSKLKSA